MSSKKIKYTLLTIFVLLSCSGNVHAQLRDTLAYLFKQRPKPFFQLDGYNSFVRSRGANAIGFKTGLDFGKRVKFSMGYMKLFTDVVDSVQVKPNKYYRGEVRSNYFTTGIEYVIYRNGPWQVNVPMHFGFGTSYYEYPDGKKANNKALQGNIILFEPAITGHYKLIRWVGIGFGVGYRVMLKNNKQLKDNLSSPIYILRLKIFVDEIYRTVFPSKKSK